MKNVLRQDRGEMSSAFMNEDGFLHASAVVSRTGVLTYRNPDGTLRKELRHPDDVLRRDSLDSMKMIPITNDHPSERLVTSENVKRLSIGNVGEHVGADGHKIMARIVVQDKAAISQAQGGKNQLSLGYRVDLIEEDGEYNGVQYDFRQTNVRYNHLALVDVGRAGNEARIVLDSGDGIEVAETNTKTIKENTVKIRLDNNCEYEGTQEIDAELKEYRGKVTNLDSKVTSLSTDLEKTKARADAADDKVKELEKVNHDEAITSGIAKHLELIGKVSERLDEATIKDLPNKSVREIQELVIKSVNKDADLKEKSDIYVEARFDGIMEKDFTSVSKNKGIISQRKATIHGDGKIQRNNSDLQDNVNNDSKIARANMIARLTNQKVHKKALEAV